MWLGFISYANFYYHRQALLTRRLQRHGPDISCSPLGRGLVQPQSLPQQLVDTAGRRGQKRSNEMERGVEGAGAPNKRNTGKKRGTYPLFANRLRLIIVRLKGPESVVFIVLDRKVGQVLPIGRTVSIQRAALSLFSPHCSGGQCPRVLGSEVPN